MMNRLTEMSQIHGQLQDYYPYNYVVHHHEVLSEPQSELTSNNNASPPSRKRSWGDHDHHNDTNIAMTTNIPRPHFSTPLHPPSSLRFQAKTEEAAPPPIAANAPMQQLSSPDQKIRLLESAGTSTSGRPTFALDLVSCLHHQNSEIDALVTLQSQRLRVGLEEARQRHYWTFVSMVEQRAAKRLKHKEVELEKAMRRNAELEEMVRQLSSENQVWLSAARDSESLVSNLRAALEHVLLQTTAQVKEGYGDSDVLAAAATVGLQADDGLSCCFNGDDKETEEERRRRRRTCRCCREKEVCVLLLPCKHLCLCKDCESKVDTCPLCDSAKNASLQVAIDRPLYPN